MTTEALVKPANIQEQLLGKINEMRQKDLIAKQKEEIDCLERRLFSGFIMFSWNYFGLSKQQIQELSDQEIEALFLLILKRVGKPAIYMRILGFGLPIVGWIFILGTSDTIQFSNSVRKIKQMVGNNLNPAKIIRSRLK